MNVLLFTLTAPTNPWRSHLLYPWRTCFYNSGQVITTCMKLQCEHCGTKRAYDRSKRANWRRRLVLITSASSSLGRISTVRRIATRSWPASAINPSVTNQPHIYATVIWRVNDDGGVSASVFPPVASEQISTGRWDKEGRQLPGAVHFDLAIAQILKLKLVSAWTIDSHGSVCSSQ